MKIDEWTSEDVRNQEGGESPTCADLPPTPSPKLKALFLQRVHKQGCPQEMHVPKQCFNHKNKGKFHIGMSYVVHTAERRKLTTTW